MTQAMDPDLDLPASASVLTRIRVGLKALSVLSDDMANPHYARLLHLSFDRDTYARLAEKMWETAEGRRILEDRRTIPAEGTLHDLAQLPEGTLGYVFARYFQQNGIEPYRETHDIHHMVTGYGIDDLGEVELQAFYFGNLGLRHAALIAFTWIPVQLKRGNLMDLPNSMRRLWAAYRRGRKSRMLLSVSFDELWSQPVSDIAERVCAPR